MSLAILAAFFAVDLTDREIIRACAEAKADQDALWQEFVRRFDPWIVRCVRSYSRRWTFHSIDQDRLLKDLIQDVYVRLLAHDRKALRRFKGKSGNEFRAYLKVVARTVVLNHFDKNRRQYDSSVSNEMGELVMSGEGPEEILKWSWEHITARLRGLEKDRNIVVFALNRIEDLSPQTISKLPGIDLSPSGVETVVSRVAQHFRSKGVD